MLKLLLLVLVIVAAAWWLLSRRAAPPPAPKPRADRPADMPTDKPAGGSQPMLACAHCGVHLPQAEVMHDAAGRPFCTEAHRLAGPR